MRRLLAGAAVAAALTAAPVFADPVSAQDVEDDDDDGGDSGLWGLLGLLGLAGLAGLKRRPDRHTFPTTYPTTGGAPPASSPNPPRP
jgi:MYXO-CTERM domain-containing protein